MIRRIWLILLLPPLLTGCFAHDSPSLTSPDPSLKIPAIKLAVQDHDVQAEAQLVKDLDSDDSAVRFYAIDGLRKLTAQDFGYRYYDDAIHRLPAIRRWQAWLASQNQDARSPATMRSAGSR